MSGTECKQDWRSTEIRKNLTKNEIVTNRIKPKHLSEQENHRAELALE